MRVRVACARECCALYLFLNFLFSHRYLLHVFLEAGCLEWSVVIGLILRDVGVIKQVLGFLDAADTETVQSVQAGLVAIDQWASSDWSVGPSLRACVCILMLFQKQYRILITNF